MSDTPILKVVVLGDGNVGKTALRNQFVHRQFVQGYKATIGADFITKKVRVESLSKSVSFQIWDTAGQERFHSLGVAFFRGADACILVYDVTSTQSLDHLEKWMREFVHQAGISNPAKFPFILVGNKTDMETERTVSSQMGRSMAKSLRKVCLELSRASIYDVVETSHHLASSVQRPSDALLLRMADTHSMGARRTFGQPPPQQPAPISRGIAINSPLTVVGGGESESAGPASYTVTMEGRAASTDFADNAPTGRRRTACLSTMTVESTASFYTAFSDFETFSSSQPGNAVFQDAIDAHQPAIGANSSLLTTDHAPSGSIGSRFSQPPRASSVSITSINAHMWQRLQESPAEVCTNETIDSLKLVPAFIPETGASQLQRRSHDTHTYIEAKVDLQEEMGSSTQRSDVDLRQPEPTLPHFEVSAKAGMHVDDPFMYIAAHVALPRFDFETSLLVVGSIITTNTTTISTTTVTTVTTTMDTIRGTSSVPLSQQPLAVQTTIQPRALSPTHQLPVPPSQRKHSADGSHAAKHMGSPAKSSPQRAVVVPSNKDHQLSAQNRQDSSFPDSSFPDSNGLHSEYDYEYEYELLEQDPGWVFDKLVSMGFNSNLSAHAVQGATTTLEKTKDQTNLLRCALYIAFLNSLEDHTEPRSVQFQFPATPSRYQPNHRTLKPAKGILREHSVMHDNNKSKQLFRKDWFDKAIGSLGLGPTTSKRSTSAGAFGSLFSKASLPDTSKGSETPLIVIPLRKNSAPLVPISSPDRPEIMQTSSASSQHARVESPDGSQPSKPSLSSRAHVRFTFPDVAIAPRDSDYDMFISPLQAVPKSADANTKGKSNDLGTDPTPEKTGSSSNASGQRGETHSKSRVEPSSIIVKHSNEFTPSELYRYYMQLLVHEDRTHMPALVNILRESVENNIFPKTINLSGVSITMSHAKAFTELLMIDFGLKCLNIEKCGLDDEVLKMVMQSALGSSTLSWLSLANNPKVKTQGVKYIAVFLKKSSSIRYLDISGISLDQQGASYLNHAFSADSEKGFRQSSVEVLKMDNSSIKSVHLEVMATGIRRSRLTHLSMRRNLLSAHAGKQLARILENTESCGSSNPILHGSSLKALDVRDNAIGSGVVDIAQALALNDQLTRLVLRSNRVDAAGFTAVVNALNTNSTLRTLDMGQNSLFSSEHPTAIESLKQMLCTNSVLSGIFLSNTNMRTNDLISLSEALPFSKCIQKLDLSHNVFEAPGFMALATVMESNTHITHIALSPLKSLKGKNSVDVDVETLNAIARMSTILNRNASSKKTDVLPPVSIRRSSSPQEMSSLDAEEEEEEEESDTEVSPTPSALRRDSLVLSLECARLDDLWIRSAMALSTLL
ncbi:hypothetical protein BASA50_001190 [Batrachochytrium salamandrivorans]|uniref:Uncharacterized protein n=1 Tax=Batrachochytrium salamandrivorans TaxID=1357716 RepID=A0ABQ8ERW8_9FUNG|nr:hypothetical protein BASA50_001190 [Batrachochytrium salamandrivorans]